MMDVNLLAMAFKNALADVVKTYKGIIVDAK